MKTDIGNCGICGGQVTVPTVQWSTVPMRPRCESCGAVARDRKRPVIDMVPNPPRGRPRITFDENHEIVVDYPYDPARIG